MRDLGETQRLSDIKNYQTSDGNTYLIKWIIIFSIIHYVGRWYSIMALLLNKFDLDEVI